MAKTVLNDRRINEVVVALWMYCIGAILSTLPFLIIGPEVQSVITYFSSMGGTTKAMPTSVLVSIVMAVIGAGCTIVFGCIGSCPGCKEAWIISNIYHFFSGVMLVSVVYAIVYIVSCKLQVQGGSKTLGAAQQLMSEFNITQADDQEQFLPIRIMKTISNCAYICVGGFILSHGLLIILAPFFLPRASICRHIFFQFFSSFLLLVFCSLTVPIRMLQRIQGIDEIECRFGVKCASLGLIIGALYGVWSFLVGLLTIFTTKKRPVNKVKMAEYLSW